jgi:hypothetical protein
MNGSLQVDEFKIIVDITEHPPIMQTRLLHLQLYRTHKASIITIIIVHWTICNAHYPDLGTFPL